MTFFYLLARSVRQWLDLPFNCAKSYCMRVDKRFNCSCADIISIEQVKLLHGSMRFDRYSGIYLVASRTFKYSFSHAKRAFCRAVKTLFGNWTSLQRGRILHLIKFKYMPLLLYVEPCLLTKTDVQLLDFTVMRFLMRILKSSNRDFVLSCIGDFNFALSSDLIENTQAIFVAKLDIIIVFINFIS
jgi:hypothetical protein